MSPQRVGGQGAGQPSPRAYLAAKEVKWPRSAFAGTRRPCSLQATRADPSRVDHRMGKQKEHPATIAPSCAMTLSEPRSRPQECVQSKSMFPESCRSSLPQSPYLHVLNKCFKPETLTKLEKKVKERTVMALERLNKNIEEAQIRQEQLLQDNRQLQEEKLHLEAEKKSFLEYLSKKNEHFTRKHEDIWKEYIQECAEIKRRRRELASIYAKRTADLRAQLLQGKKIQFDLKQQFQALRHISIVKERQEVKLQTLQKETEKTQGETAAKDQEAHFEFLRQKTFLEKQLKEVDMIQLGESKPKKLKRKAQAWKLTAKQAYFEFCLGVNRENEELCKEWGQVIQEYEKLEATRSLIKKQQQQLKEKQWCQEALMRGRQRLQAEHEHHNRTWCSKEHGAFLGTKSRINPN